MEFFFNIFYFLFTQGLAFTREERQLLGIHGLLPAVVKSEEEQVQHAVVLLDRLENELDKYIYLNGLLVSFYFSLFTNAFFSISNIFLNFNFQTLGSQ